MLDETTMEKLSERLVNRIESLNAFMLKKLGDQLYDIGTFTPSQIRQIYQSIQYGNNLNEIISKLAEVTDKNEKDIIKIFEEVAKKNQAFSKKFYEYKKVPFIPYEENIPLQRQVKALSEITLKQYENLAYTTAYMVYNPLNGAREFINLSEVYQKITDTAILGITTGRESYGQTIREIMREMSRKGIQTVDYASGYHRRFDSAVRMNIMDGIRRVNNELQVQFGEEFGADGVEVTHHKNPAPDHEDTVDGKQFSLYGDITIKGKKYRDYNEVNNSLKRHVSELNCYHHIYSIVLGVSEPNYTQKELNEDKKNNHDGFDYEGKHYTNYEGTQLQRKIETEIRKTKEEQIGSKAIKDIDNVYKCQDKIDKLTKKYQELSDASGLPTKIDRLRVEGFRRVKKK